MEILAPVGSIETFYAALEGGADAVYAGAPGFNARNLPNDLSLEEIGAMIRYCHDEKKKFYVAANSLILEKELPTVIEQLSILEQLNPDALIVQDLGLIHLIRNYFPKLKMHGSTLMTVHNSAGVRVLSNLGCERVVVARELTLKEIESVSRRSDGVELEVFIHGAMCFSYSGLCLFSSYLGGKSSLRGRCVQPCRRAYSAGTASDRKKTAKGAASKYLFSMNDLSGLAAVPQLRELKISSLKIEGRLRSAHYVKSIVQAYRTVVDAGPGEQQEALEQAEILAEQAMSRNTSSGYFFSPQPAETISPHHSGNMGTHLGRFSTTKTVGEELTCRFVTKAALSKGDRLRLHFEPSGERRSFRLKSLFVLGRQMPAAKSGDKVSIALPLDVLDEIDRSVEVYKIDGPAGSTLPGKDNLQIASVGQSIAKTRGKRNEYVHNILYTLRDTESSILPDLPQKPLRHFKKGKGARPAKKRLGIPWWLKTDSIKILFGEHDFYPDRYLLSFDKQLLGQAGQIKKYLGKRSRLVTWALPPVIMENELGRFHKQIDVLLRSGFRSFQLGHISQAEFFRGQKAHLYADYTFNLFNSQSIMLLDALGFKSGLTAIEGDREMLHNMLGGFQFARKHTTRDKEQDKTPFSVGCVVYGAPALFTSRLSPKFFQFDQQILSPRDEPYVIRKKEGFTQTFPEKPFSLLPYLDDLKQMGMQYVVVDISGKNSKREIADVKERLDNNGRYSKLSTFNYLGNLL